MWNISKKCSEEIRSDQVFQYMFIYLMLISTKKNIDKIVQEPCKHDVIINNNDLHVYVYLILEWVVNMPGHRFKRSMTMLTDQH